MDIIQLTWKIDYGVPGCDTSTKTPLARAVNQLLKKGFPFSSLRMCFFKDATATLRWLGVFVLSAGNRVIYFPGFNNDLDQIYGLQGRSLKWNQSFDFDHISLERNHSKWHVTSKDSTDHLGSPKALSLNSNRVLWLGMSMADAPVMRIVKQETKIVVDSPPGDSQRRRGVFCKAIKEAKHSIVSVNDKHPILFDEWFLHFGLIVGPRGFKLYSGGELAFPYGSPFLATPLPERLTELPLRSHRLELSDDIDIQITVSCLPGRLMVPVAITGTSVPSTALNSSAPVSMVVSSTQ